MLFEKRQDFLPARTGVMGDNISFEVTREFHIESIMLAVTLTVNATAVLEAGRRIGDVIRAININVSDGANTRAVVNGVSGSGAIEYARQTGGLDYATLNLQYSALPQDQAVTFYVPIWFAQPQINDPFRSMFLLPAPRYNQNIALNVQLENAAVVLSAGAITGVSIRPVINRRVVNVRDWRVFDSEFRSSRQAYAQNAANQLFELDTPGSYTGILLRTRDSSGARLSPMIAGGDFRLQALNTNFRRFRLDDIAAENARSADRPVIAASAVNDFGEFFLDFMKDEKGSSVQEMSSLLDANVYAPTGAKIQLLQDIAGGGQCEIDYVSYRIFGDLSALKLKKQ